MTAGPMTNEQIDAIRTRLKSPDLDANELRQIAITLLADNDAQYAEADSWRESYRLVKGLTDDEMNAMIAVDDAAKPHPRPCHFPHEACLCDKPENERESGDCLGIHRSPDGYRDCDGESI